MVKITCVTFWKTLIAGKLFDVTLHSWLLFWDKMTSTFSPGKWILSNKLSRRVKRQDSGWTWPALLFWRFLPSVAISQAGCRLRLHQVCKSARRTGTLVKITENPCQYPTNCLLCDANLISARKNTHRCKCPHWSSARPSSQLPSPLTQVRSGNLISCLVFQYR